MIFTSYYGNLKNIHKDREAVSISRTQPSGIDLVADMRLAPTAELRTAFADGKIGIEDFARLYEEDVLFSLDPAKIAEEHEGKTLLCYESPSDFCHRKVVRKWLAKHGKLSLEYQNSYTIAVVGSRGYENEEEFFRLMDRLLASFDDSQKISLVSGGAAGADSLAESYAQARGVGIDVIEADWSRYGKSAGFVRNKDIWKRADFGIAFWDGESKGTKHSFDLARNLGKTLVVYDYVQKRFFVKNFEPYVTKADAINNRKKRYKAPSLF